MSLEEINILGVKISITEKGKILEEVRKWLNDAESGKQKAENIIQKPLLIFTPNPEIVEFAQKDDNFKQIINTAQINIPDGQGVCWAVKKLHNKKIQRITGIDFMLDLVKLAANERVRIGLIGGKRGVALATAKRLQKKYPEAKISALDGSNLLISDDLSNLDNLSGKIASWIIENKISILFVALGFPKQELFINEIGKIISRKDTSEAPNESGRGGRQARSARHDSSQVEGLVKPLVMMAVGGAFDNISGRVPRAPVWMREKGLEWLYRLIHEPGRWKRQLAGLKFFWRIFFK